MQKSICRVSKPRASKSQPQINQLWQKLPISPTPHAHIRPHTHNCKPCNPHIKQKFHLAPGTSDPFISYLGLHSITTQPVSHYNLAPYYTPCCPFSPHSTATARSTPSHHPTALPHLIIPQPRHNAPSPSLLLYTLTTHPHHIWHHPPCACHLHSPHPQLAIYTPHLQLQ